MEEKKLKKMQNKLAILEGISIVFPLLFCMLLVVNFYVYSYLINYMLMFFAIFGIILIYNTISYKNKIQNYKNDMQKSKFEEIEKEIAKHYTILNFPDKEFEIFAKEAEAVAYDKYYLEEGTLGEPGNFDVVGEILEENKEELEEDEPNITEEEFDQAYEIPGKEEDYVEGYEEFNKPKDLKLPKIKLKYVTEFARKGNTIYLMSFEETRILKNYEEKFTNYVLVSDIDSKVRLHIQSDPFEEVLEDFDDIYYDYEKIIKAETYEAGNTFLKLNDEDKKFLVNLYNETKLENSIVIKDGKLYIRVVILQKEDSYKNIAKFLMEVFERFSNY